MFKRTILLSVAAIGVSLSSGPLQAAITPSGDVRPDNPSHWDSLTNAYIGSGGIGSLNVNDGSHLYSLDAHIGNWRAQGTVTIDGTGSTWDIANKLYIERDSTLNIINGGLVAVHGDTLVDSQSDTIHFNNGTLNTGSLFCSLESLTGTGVINTHSLGTDIDLVFDATSGLSQSFTICNNLSQNITVNLDINGSHPMLIGHTGTGTMSISDGLTIEATSGYIGQHFGSKGELTVNGNDSTMTYNDSLMVGYYGNGKLKIANGGSVNNRWKSYIGYTHDSTGEVTVDGEGSTWTNLYSPINDDCGRVHIGYNGNGKLSVTNGGSVSNSLGYLGLFSSSTGEVDINGAGSTWVNYHRFFVGTYGKGKLTISEGGTLNSHEDAYIGYGDISTGEVAIDGTGSTWKNAGLLFVGNGGTGTLAISNGGLVGVGSTLTVDSNQNGDSFINMSTGGMLALAGDADGSIIEFLELVEGTDAIQYWDGLDWAPITDGTIGEDYLLEYCSTGDLAGYTMLTVGVVPEPGAVALILLGLGTLLVVRRRR